MPRAALVHIGHFWWSGPCRVYQTSDLSEGGLTLGRAIGDFSLEKVNDLLCCQHYWRLIDMLQVGVICEPVVSKYQFHQDDQVFSTTIGTVGIT